MTDIIFETALVNVTGTCIKRSLTRSLIFGQMALILVYGLIFNGLKLCKAVVDKVDVSPIDASPKSIRYLQRIFYLKCRLNIITLLQFYPSICHVGTWIMNRIDKVFKILFLLAIAIRFIKASEDLHHLIMLFLIRIPGIVHPIDESRFTKISASLRHHLYRIVFQILIFRHSIPIVTVFGASDS